MYLVYTILQKSLFKVTKYTGESLCHANNTKMLDLLSYTLAALETSFICAFNLTFKRVACHGKQLHLCARKLHRLHKCMTPNQVCQFSLYINIAFE